MNKYLKENQGEQQREEVKLEDILNSIRGMIDDHKLEYDHSENSDDSKGNNYPFADEKQLDDEEILELNQIADNSGVTNEGDSEFDNNSEEMLSEQVKTKSAKLFNQYTSQAKKAKISSGKELDNLIHNLIRPMLKDWLNNNLPRLVEEIVRDELRRLAPDK